MTVDIHQDEMATFLRGDHGAPFRLLGPQQAGENRLSVRVFQPNARAVALVDSGSGERWEMARLHDDGFFEATVERSLPGFRYHYDVTTDGDSTTIVHDPYAY